MRKHHIVPIVLFFITSILLGCSKETSDTVLGDDADSNTEHSMTVAFSPGSISMETVDSVVVDLIGGSPADYHHFTLKKAGNNYFTDETVPEAGYNAYVIIYLRPENNNARAFLYHQVYGGGSEPILKAAPKALSDDYDWKLMGHVFDRSNEFFALVGIAPSNPMLYLFTNVQKRNYIYIDKSYLNNDQPISSGTYEYHVTAPLSHPLAVPDAFASTVANMEGKSWTIFSSMVMSKNEQTGQENIFYFQHLK